MLTLTLVRHGESTDNLRSVWSGWNDVPLTNHGMNQAKAIGESLASFQITAIVASDLKRALWTAQQIRIHQLQDPQPPLTETNLIREQHFGEAEGQEWSPPGVEPQTEGGKVYPVPEGREGRFLEGECLDDVKKRVGDAFDMFVLPYLEKSKGKKAGEVNLVFVSHGIAIAETISAIFARCANGKGVDADTWRGLRNTAWTRLVIGLEDEQLEYPEELSAHPAKSNPQIVGDIANIDTGEMIATAVEATGQPHESGNTEILSRRIPPINAKVVAVNQYSHLDGIESQRGGIGSSAHNKQKAVTEFFGGGELKDQTPQGTSEI